MAGTRLKWKNEETKADLVLAKDPAREVYVVDELTGKLERHKKGEATLTLKLNGVGCGFWQIVTSQEEARQLAARAETQQPFLNYTFQKR